MTAPGRHEDAAARFAEWAAARFPGAGVAIAGSVATATHRDDSDLDLLVVHASFRRSIQFTLRLGDVPAAVICLCPAVADTQARDWRFGAGPARWVSGMIRSAQILVDPAGLLEGLRKKAIEIERERGERSGEILEALRSEAAAIASRLRHGTGFDARAGLRLLTLTLEAWNLAHGVDVDSKAANRATFARIRLADAALAQLLEAAVPLSPDGREPLLAACAHVFDGLPRRFGF